MPPLSVIELKLYVFDDYIRFFFIQMAKREEMIDKLRSETSYLKDQQRDKEKEVKIILLRLRVNVSSFIRFLR